MFSPTKNSMQCEIQVQIEKYSFKSSSGGWIKLMAYVYGFKETYYDSSRGCEEKLIYYIIYHFYATAASACYVHIIQNINVTVRFLLPYILKHTHTHTKINKKYNFPAPVSIKSTKYTFPKRSCWTKREKEKRNFTRKFNASGILPYLRNKSQLQMQKSKTSILSHFPSPLSDWKNKDTSEDLSRAMEERLLYLFAGQPIITSSRRGILSL